MSDLTGELIDGRYQLLRQVANGGMASIYEAIDIRLDRKNPLFTERVVKHTRTIADGAFRAINDGLPMHLVTTPGPACEPKPRT